MTCSETYEILIFHLFVKTIRRKQPNCDFCVFHLQWNDCIGRCDLPYLSGETGLISPSALETFKTKEILPKNFSLRFHPYNPPCTIRIVLPPFQCVLYMVADSTQIIKVVTHLRVRKFVLITLFYLGKFTLSYKASA